MTDATGEVATSMTATNMTATNMTATNMTATNMKGRFEDEVVFVVGGTSGIGAAAAARFIAEGADVVVAGRDEDRGRETADALGEHAWFLPVDATDRDSVERAVATIDNRFGRMDGLVNAAGAVSVRPFATMSADHWDRTIAVNLTATFNTCQASLDLLRRTAGNCAPQTTAIVNVASLNAVGGDTGMTAYGAAKAGVVNMSRALALEMVRSGVRVNCVSPGAVDTPMTIATAGEPDRAVAFEQAIPIGRFGRPEEIAAAIAFVASDDASFMVGANLVVDGGVTSATGHPDLLAMFDMEP